MSINELKEEIRLKKKALERYKEERDRYLKKVEELNQEIFVIELEVFSLVDELEGDKI